MSPERPRAPRPAGALIEDLAEGARPALVLGPVLIAAASLALAVLAFRFHPVGDFFTESDFYANYVPGARELQHGHFDLGRYAIHGPAYEVMLAATGWLLRDLFTSARVISVISAMIVLASAWMIARARLGAAASAWLVALVAVNPTFIRYGYSTGSDMLSFAFFSLALAALFATRNSGGVVAGGLAAALATLTRYNLASVVPGALVVLLGRSPRRAGMLGAALFAAVFALALAPLGIAAVRSGSVPGAGLLKDASLYLDDAPARTIEALYGPRGGAATNSTPTGAGAIASRFAWRTVTGVLGHARDDARLLLGWPAAALIVVSLAWLIAARAIRPLLALLPPFALTFLGLAPIYYSERYSMVLLPLYVAPAALALGRMTERGGRGGAAALVAGGLVLLATARECVELQRLEYESLPTETLESGRAIGAEATPGDRVLARKAHIAYASDLDFVVFPNVQTLAELGAFCRREHVSYLYYSWYEVRLRPQFGFLLDTAAVVPGLEPILATTDKPSATYRVGPELGSTPSWWLDARSREAIKRRVNALLAPSLSDRR